MSNINHSANSSSPVCPVCGCLLNTTGQCLMCHFRDVFPNLPDPTHPPYEPFPNPPGIPFPPFEPNPPGIPFPPFEPKGPIGWICPRCGRGNSPYNDSCGCTLNTWTTTCIAPNSNKS